MNNPYAHAAAAYRQAAAAVHPTVTVVKLYDAILLAIVQAMRAKDAGQHEEAFIKVMRAATILRGLDHSLDFDKGGSVAERLHNVYRSYILALHLSFGKKDVLARYRKLYVSLADLRNSWASIAGMTEDDTEPQMNPDEDAAGAKTKSDASAGSGGNGDGAFDANLFIGLTTAQAEKTTSVPPRARPPVRALRPRPVAG